MDIEMTHELRTAIVKQISDRLMQEIRAQVNINELAKQVRADLIVEIRAKLVSQISGDIHKQMNTTGLVKETLKAAEEKFNRRIEKTLSQGVSLRVTLDGE